MCLPPIQVTDKMASKMAFSYNPELINPHEAFLITQKGNQLQRDGFGKGTKGFISHKQHQYILFPLGSRRLGITLVFRPLSGSRN